MGLPLSSDGLTLASQCERFAPALRQFAEPLGLGGSRLSFGTFSAVSSADILSAPLFTRRDSRNVVWVGPRVDVPGALQPLCAPPPSVSRP